MYRHLLRALIVSIIAALTAVGVPSPSQAATAEWAFNATTGATKIKAADSTISSDLTAAATVTTTSAPTSENTTAGVTVEGVLRTGAVTSTAEKFDTPDGIAIRTVTETAGVNLLSGLITADAVKTTVTTYANDDGTHSVEGGTEFVNLHIVGVDLPAEIPKNKFVGIKGVAAIGLNYFASHTKDANRNTIASGISIRLLEGAEVLNDGATIHLNPSMTFLAPIPPPNPGADLIGFGYGTRVLAEDGGTIEVTSGPTAWRPTPIGGSDGATLTNATASVDVTGVLSTGEVKSTSTSQLFDNGDAFVTTTNEVAGLQVLGNVVTADAIKSTSHGEWTEGVYSGSMDLTFVNLTVAGQPIDVDVAPNTTIDVAGVGKVTINQQTTAGTTKRVRAIHIVLDTAQAGLPVGAEIEVAVAATKIVP